jgi:hypothetical protein
MGRVSGGCGSDLDSFGIVDHFYWCSRSYVVLNSIAHDPSSFVRYVVVIVYPHLRDHPFVLTEFNRLRFCHHIQKIRELNLFISQARSIIYREKSKFTTTSITNANLHLSLIPSNMPPQYNIGYLKRRYQKTKRLYFPTRFPFFFLHCR